MITRRELVRALQRRGVADWVVLERAQELGIADETRAVRRREKRTRTTLIVHHDVPQGRGSARLEISASDGDALAIVDQAIVLANEAVGEAWKTVPPAAPAKVKLLDPELDPQNPRLADLALDLAAARLLGKLRRPAGSHVSATARVLRERTIAQAKSGFHDDWLATTLRLDALVTVGGSSLEISREARRSSHLAFDEAIANAVTDLQQLAAAGTPAPGPCALVLGPDALLHGDELGVWSVFAVQGDSVVERQGLTRYRLNTPIAPGADQVDKPLAIASDGSIDYALRSAPLGDDGDAIRRFPLVERGVSVGVAMTMREAALRRLDPNGGLRNLLVSAGTWDGKPADGRTIEARRLRALSIDPVTGDASLEIALGIEHQNGTARVFTGGTVRLDLVVALAHARRSATTLRRGSYFGPAAVLIEDVELIV
ncbi:MAG TPA: metallopeptidase TldD-related protein [Kofleriaceae bacterium]|nr:metallopeptidase TldD-related protein [Kofleriaceae bacterium]